MNATALSVSHVLYAFGIGSAYALWPIIGRYSGAPGTWINTVVVIGSAISAIALAYPSMKEQSLPNMNAIWILLFAGLINGAAVYFYSVKAADPHVPMNAFIITTIVIMVVMTLAFNFLLNGVVPSVKQGLGLAFAVLAVILLAS
ncbi:MAG: hypothetical protein WC790_00675 [Candidatus Paceibacterota bacterium]|jgi:drug/metabolite transporter (DMT)-like permease